MNFKSLVLKINSLQNQSKNLEHWYQLKLPKIDISLQKFYKSFCLDVAIGHPMRREPTCEGLLVKLADHYTTRAVS